MSTFSPLGFASNLLQDEISRRIFVERLAKVSLGVTVLPFAGQAFGKEEEESNKSIKGFGSAKNIIWLQMMGGMSHIDTFDPKTGSTKGAKDPISSKAGFQLSGYLPKLASEGADKIAIIRSMSSKTGVHGAGQYLMRTGYEERSTIRHPSMGAWAQKLLGPSHKTLPSSVCVGRNPDHGNGFFPAAFSPLPIRDPESGLQYSFGDASAEVMQKRMALLNKLDGGFRAKFQDTNLKAYTDFYDNTLQLLTSSDLKAFKISDEPDSVRQQYGGVKNKFGQGCLLARRLIEHGVRSVEVAMGGWDMHNDIADAMNDKGGQLDSALTALMTDLQSKGLLSSTLIVLCSEFGRTPTINGRGGRDHFPKVFSTLLAGGGVKGGTVYGSSDKEGREVADKQATIADFHATVGHIMGMNVVKPVFSPSGRPFTIANKGSIIQDVLA